jgi:hypothetical protein
MTVDFSSKPWRSEEEAHVFSSAEKKRTVNPKFYTQKKYPPEMKEKLRHY